MTFQEFKDALEVINADAHIEIIGDQCVVRLWREADKTTVIATHVELERAIEFALTRFIEARRRHPTAPSYIEYPTKVGV